MLLTDEIFVYNVSTCRWSPILPWPITIVGCSGLPSTTRLSVYIVVRAYSHSYLRPVLTFSPIVNKHLEKALVEAGYTGDALDAIMKKIIMRGTVRSLKNLPESIRRVFVTSMDCSAEAHIQMQAAFQEFCDNAVSKVSMGIFIFMKCLSNSLRPSIFPRRPPRRTSCGATLKHGATDAREPRSIVTIAGPIRS